MNLKHTRVYVYVSVEANKGGNVKNSREPGVLTYDLNTLIWLTEKDS